MIRTLLRSAAKSASALFLFLLLVAAARVLGPRDFGRFSFALAMALVFEPVLNPGFFYLLLRQAPPEKEAGAPYLLHALLWKAVAIPILFLAINFLAPRIDPSPATLLAVNLIAVSQIFKSMKDAVRAAFIARNWFGREFASLGVERLALLLAGLLALQSGGGLTGLCAAFVVVRFFDALLAWSLTRAPFGRLSFHMRPRFLWTMLVAGIPVGTYYLTENLYGYLDTVMLAALRTQTEVGHYNAAYRLFEGFAAAVPLLLSTALVPALLRTRLVNLENYRALLGNGIKYACGLGAWIGGNALLLAPPLMRFFFGGGYEPSILPLRILVAGFPAVFAMNFINTSFIAMNRWKAPAVATTTGLALNAVLNLFLIPRHSHDGAAAATILVEASLFMGMCFFLRDEARGMGKVVGILALALGVGAVAVLLTLRWGLVAQLAVGNAAFIAVIVLAGFVGAGERRALLDGFTLLFRGRPVQQ